MPYVTRYDHFYSAPVQAYSHWIGRQVTHERYGKATVVAIEATSFSPKVRLRFGDGSEDTWGIESFLATSGPFVWPGRGLRLGYSGELVNYARLDRAVAAINAALSRTKLNPGGRALHGLDSTDLRLCYLWTGARVVPPEVSVWDIEAASSSAEAARLLTARCAEHVARHVYGVLYNAVEDVSVAPVAGTAPDMRWTTHDLVADSRPIDVKCARRSPSNKQRYVEYFLPRFKRDRVTAKDVAIAGVLMNFELDNEQIAREGANYLFLGEVTRDRIERVCAWVNKRFPGLLDLAGAWRDEFQPGWAFEYPPEFYPGRAQTLADLGHLTWALAPTPVPKVIPSWYFIYAPDVATIRAMELPAVTQGILEDLHRMNKAIGITRPSLYLYCMGFCVEAITQGLPWTEAGEPLMRVLFGDATKCDVVLGLYDELRYIKRLLDAFKAISGKVDMQRERFTAFRLVHPDILRARNELGDWRTLLAYCGGKTIADEHTRCGNTPLVLGFHEHCSECGHLICEQCGYCAHHCASGASRRQTLRANRLAAAEEEHSFMDLDSQSLYQRLQSGCAAGVLGQPPVVSVHGRSLADSDPEWDAAYHAHMLSLERAAPDELE